MKQFFLGNLGTKVMALALAVLLWIYIYSRETAEKSFTASFHPNLSVAQEGYFVTVLAPEGTRLSPGSRVSGRVIGPRGKIEAQRLQGLRCEPSVDGAAFQDDSGELTRDLTRQDFGLPDEISVEVEPPRVRILYERYVEKEIEILAEASAVSGRPARGYQVKEIVALPARIRVRVPAKSGKDLSVLRIAAPSIEGLSETQVFPGLVEDPPGFEVRRVPGQNFTIQVSLEPTPFSRTLTVPLHVEGAPDVLPRVRLDDPLEVGVLLEGPQHLVESLKEDELRVFVAIPLGSRELPANEEQRKLKDFRHYFVREPALRGRIKVTVMPERQVENREARITLLPAKAP